MQQTTASGTLCITAYAFISQNNYWHCPLPTQYAEQGLCNGMWSIHLSVPFTHHTPMLQVCCCGPSKQETVIDCCLVLSSIHTKARCVAANAGSATLSAGVGSWTQTCLDTKCPINFKQQDFPASVLKLDKVTQKTDASESSVKQNNRHVTVIHQFLIFKKITF